MLKTKTIHFSYSLDGGAYGGVSYNANMNGYTPIALQGYSTGNHHVQVASVSFGYIALKNTGSDHVSSNGNVNILYIKQ